MWTAVFWHLTLLVMVALCACQDLDALPSLVNTLGVPLPPDAAPLSKQALRLMAGEPRTLAATLDNYGTGASHYIAAQPCPYLPYLTSFISASPIPRWQFEKYGRKWTESGHCVTNATFTLAEWTPGRRQVFVLDPDYNGRYKARLERITVQFITGTSVGIFPYENSEADLASVTPADLPRVQADPTLRRELFIWPHQSTAYLLFQTKKPPFNNVKVRQAIAHAIDRDTLCKVVMQGLAAPAYTMLPPNFPGYVGDRFQHLQAFNPTLARKLLADAGYPGGKGFPRVEFWIGGSAQTVRGVAQAIQGMLKTHLNINIQIVTRESAAYLSSLYQHTIPFGLAGFQSDYPDPHNLLSMVWHSQPAGHGRHDWANPTFDRLLEQADAEMNPVERFRLYARAEQLLADEVGGVFLYHGVNAELRKPWVRGIPKTNAGYYPFWGNYITHTRVYVGLTP